MSEIIYNRYQGRYVPSGTISVDSDSMASAILIMKAKRGSEPISVSMLEANIYVAGSSPSATLNTQVFEEDIINPLAGSIFPSSASLPIGNEVVLNAVANDGYIFEKFIDTKGAILSENKEYTFTLSGDTEIRGVFKKIEIDPEDISISPTISKLLRVNSSDPNSIVSQENQDRVNLSVTVDDQTGLIYATFVGNLNNLNSFASTNPAQGTAKWLGLLLDYGESYKQHSLYYNNSELDAQEFEDANNLGITGDSTIIIWVKAEDINQVPKKICVYSDDKRKKVWINIGFQNV